MYRGNFDIEDYVVERTPLTHAALSGDTIALSASPGQPARMTLSVSMHGETTVVAFTSDDPSINRVWLRIVAEKAGHYLKRSVLELGGKDPLIVLRDADLDFAADAAAWGAFLHQGEICMSTERIIVERPVAAAFIDKLNQRAKALKVGDPRDPSVSIGPLMLGNLKVGEWRELSRDEVKRLKF